MIPDDNELPADLAALLDGLPIAGDDHTPPEFTDGPQDDLDELGAAGDSPNTGAQAIAAGRQMIRDDVYVGVGYCLKTVRSLYGVGALYPDAETGWEQADNKHPGDPMETPWGVPEWWTNGRHGHVTISLGRHNGRRLSLTTDYVRSGYEGIAPTAALGPWCGGTYAGWTNDINGVVVWRAPKPAPEPAPEPQLWTLADRRAFLARALQRARDNHAKQTRIDSLEAWVGQLDRRIAKHQ